MKRQRIATIAIVLSVATGSTGMVSADSIPKPIVSAPVARETEQSLPTLGNYQIQSVSAPVISVTKKNSTSVVSKVACNQTKATWFQSIMTVQEYSKSKKAYLNTTKQSIKSVKSNKISHSHTFSISTKKKSRIKFQITASENGKKSTTTIYRLIP